MTTIGHGTPPNRRAAPSSPSSTRQARVDLEPFEWFGTDAALATIENMGVTLFFVVGTGALHDLPLPVRVPPWARP